MTVASVLIDDGKTRLLFDPAWTRPGLKHILNLEKFSSDSGLVSSVLQRNRLTKIDAVFSSHSHFDHVIDAPMISLLTGAVFYVDESSERIARAYQDKRIRTIRLIPGREVRVGDFLITPLPRQHAKILHLLDFLPGQVPVEFSLSFWDYHAGETWFYFIQHPEGSILLDQGSDSLLEVIGKHTTKVDVLIQGVANRRSDEQMIDGYAKFFRPQIFIPVHFDNFLADFNNGEETYLPGIGLEEVLDKMKKAYPQMTVSKPHYAVPITILDVKR